MNLQSKYKTLFSFLLCFKRFTENTANRYGQSETSELLEAAAAALIRLRNYLLPFCNNTAQMN